MTSGGSPSHLRFVLLAQEAQAVEQLPGPLPGPFEALLQFLILTRERDHFRRRLPCRGLCGSLVHRAQSCFRLMSTAPPRSHLVSQASNQLFQLIQRLEVRSCAVGHRVLLPGFAEACRAVRRFPCRVECALDAETSIARRDCERRRAPLPHDIRRRAKATRAAHRPRRGWSVPRLRRAAHSAPGARHRVRPPEWWAEAGSATTDEPAWWRAVRATPPTGPAGPPAPTPPG